MTERDWWYVLFVTSATFILVVVIAGVLIYRGGHTKETKAVLDAIEGGRQQLTVSTDTTHAELRTVKELMRKIVSWISHS